MDARNYEDAISARLTPPRLCDSTVRIAPDAQCRWPPTNSADNPPVGTHLSRAGGLGIGRIARFDVTADGQCFLMVQPAGSTDSAAPASIIVVQNWLEEL